MKTLNAKEMLRQVTASLAGSLTAYQTYLSKGKTYEYARLIKQYNLEVYQLLQNHSLLLPARLRPDALALIRHYEAWLERWNDLDKKLSPELNDLFVFENPHTFPKEAAQRLEAEYDRLKSL